jgi:hypothetical protein
LEGRDAGRHVERHAAEHLGDRDRVRRLGNDEEGEHEAGEGGDEEAAVARPVGVLGAQVGEVGRARVEVVAVGRAADAGLAVGVGHEHERGLPVDALHRQQRADRAAPAALAVQVHPAHEAAAQRAEQQQRAGGPVVVESELAQHDERHEQRDRDDVAVLLHPRRRGQRAREPERARRLVGRGQRADVAPQPGRDQEQRGQHRDHELPHHEQAVVGGDDQQPCDHERGDQAADADRPPRRH